MLRIALQIGLTVMALLITASISVAAECANDPNECTLKKLCEVATTVDGGNMIWSTEASSAKHVSTAQTLGMECGITPILDPCDIDPNECKVSQICGKATTESAGKKSWDVGAAAYVAKAKEYGLSCDVVAQSTSARKVCSASSLEGCQTSQLCGRATKWGEWTSNPSLKPYAKEAQRRGLTCGVSKEKALDLKKAFTSHPKLKRQQIQYALKKLGFYAFSVDGSWGKGTSAGLKKFVDNSNLKGKNESQIFVTLLSRVSVPSSFEAKSIKKVTTTSNSNKKVSGNRGFACDRTGLPLTGFKSKKGAEYWYPEKIWFVIAADESWMGSYYGNDKDRTLRERRNNHLTIPVSNRRFRVNVDGKELSDQKESTVWVNLITSGNFVPIGGASYKCGKAKATSWEPD